MWRWIGEFKKRETQDHPHALYFPKGRQDHPPPHRLPCSAKAVQSVSHPPGPPGKKLFSRQTVTQFECPSPVDHHPQISLFSPLQNLGREEARRGKYLRGRLSPSQTQAKQPSWGSAFPGAPMALQGRGLLPKVSPLPRAGTAAARTGGERAASCPRPHKVIRSFPCPRPSPRQSQTEWPVGALNIPPHHPGFCSP